MILDGSRFLLCFVLVPLFQVILLLPESNIFYLKYDEFSFEVGVA